MNDPMEVPANSSTNQHRPDRGPATRRARWARYAITAAVLAGMTYLAPVGQSAAESGAPAETETQPDESRPNRGDRPPLPRPILPGPGRGIFGGKPPLRPATQPGAAPTDLDWAEVTAFMKANSPVKFEMYLKMPDKPFKENVGNGIFNRYRDLQQLKIEDPKLYELELHRIRVEDEIFKSLRDYHMAQVSQDKEKAREALRTAVGRNLDNLLAEKRHRIVRLQHQLDALTDQLDTLKTETTRMDERRERTISSQTDSLLRTGLPQRVGRHSDRPGGPPESAPAFPNE